MAVGFGAERTCGLDSRKDHFSPVSTAQDERPEQDAPFSAFVGRCSSELPNQPTQFAFFIQSALRRDRSWIAARSRRDSGGVEVDDQLEFGRLLHGDIVRVRAAQNFVDQLVARRNRPG